VFLQEVNVLWHMGEEFGCDEGVGEGTGGETETEDAGQSEDVDFPGCDAGSHIRFDDDGGGLCLVDEEDLDVDLEGFI
jgi:hypothetical protein